MSRAKLTSSSPLPLQMPDDHWTVQLAVTGVPGCFAPQQQGGFPQSPGWVESPGDSSAEFWSQEGSAGNWWGISNVDLVDGDHLVRTAGF